MEPFHFLGFLLVRRSWDVSNVEVFRESEDEEALHICYGFDVNDQGAPVVRLPLLEVFHVNRLFTRRAARRVAERATRHGVPHEIAHHIAYAARKERLRYALAFAMFEQESDFKVIYGHDGGGLFPGAHVNKVNYAQFREHLIATGGSGANGVGLGQVTYWTYIRDHRGLWKPKVQVYLATSILADLVHRLGEFTGTGAYNGGEGNPNESYAREVLARADKWRPILAGKD